MKAVILGAIITFLGWQLLLSNDAFAQNKSAGEGVYKTQSGPLTIVAISDAQSVMKYDLLIGISLGAQKKIASDNKLSANAQGYPSWVNAFLVVFPGGTVLVDTGNGPSANLIPNLKEAGFTPDDITAVLLTHFHPDHIGGLLDSSGQAQFKNAVVYADALEDDYWIGQKSNTKAIKALEPYKQSGRYQTFSPGDQVIDGVTAVELYGHTPGHVGFLFEGGQEPFLFWGDIVHVYMVQFALPEVSLTFDVDSKAAAVTRRKIFDEAAQKGYLVAGAHLPFPGMGRVKVSGQAFEYQSVQ
ncbi:MAG: MBL fold metallo-hydrolase [Deltaproteobacteria bacterium]|jgi:glyoxylase-like metal-dependent hydrolase (beta-lactamase superfamily II)|nr:MBL fold metallo-hydrolase [Deltaproteobacteria bacterium]